MSHKKTPSKVINGKVITDDKEINVDLEAPKKIEDAVEAKVEKTIVDEPKVDPRDELVKGRGFDKYEDAVKFMTLDRYKKLGASEHVEYENWLKKIK